MTGIIVELARGQRTGVIRAEDGQRVLFSAAALLGSFETLAVGRRVRFDLDHACPEHSAMRVVREPPVSTAPKKAKAAPDLRYTGFDQTRGVRSYSFDALVSGLPIKRFVVTVDLALLVKHHIGVQEVPALCLRKLVADLETSPDCARHELGDEDLLAHASARAARAHRKRPKPAFRGRRGSPPPGPSRPRSALG